MSDWKLLLNWTFDGERFDDHGLALDDLKELAHLRDALVETTKELWRSEHPERERLPRNFEQSLTLRFFEIQPGSSCVPVNYSPEPQMPLPATVPEDTITGQLVDAAALLVDTYAAIHTRQPLPTALPRAVLPKFALLGSTLAPGERVFVEVPGRQKIAVTQEAREQLRALAAPPWTDAVDLLGHVTSASLKGRGTIEVDGEPVEINFSESDVTLVTEALHRHEKLLLRVVGRAEFAPPHGALRKINEINSLGLVESARPIEPDTTPIWELAERLASTVPAEAWASLPKDGARNVDLHLRRKGAGDKS